MFWYKPFNPFISIVYVRRAKRINVSKNQIMYRSMQWDQSLLYLPYHKSDSKNDKKMLQFLIDKIKWKISIWVVVIWLVQVIPTWT